MRPHDDRMADDHAIEDDGWDVVLMVAIPLVGIVGCAAVLWWLWGKWAALGTP